MIYLTFLIPIVTCLVLFFKFRKETVWWEYLLVFIPSVGASFLTEHIMIRYNTHDTEYHGSYAVAVRHYDTWNEWIHRTCYRTVRVGKHTRHIPYDCSYCKTHHEYWVAIESSGKERRISRSDYQKLANLWGTQEQFIDMHRRYYTKDGDAQQYAWNRQPLHALTFTDSHSYENPTQAASTLYRFSDVTPEDVKDFGLQEYPKEYHIDCYGVTREDHRPILGSKVSEEAQRTFQFINGYYGKKHQFRMYVCLFPDGSASQAEKQRELWKGGNKNELVVCIGTDKSASRVKWASTFSWCDDTSMEVYLKQYLAGCDSLNLVDLGVKVVDGLQSGKWHRKNFEDFKYIKVEMTEAQYIWFFIIIVLLNIGVSAFVVLNDIRNEDYYFKYRY